MILIAHMLAGAALASKINTVWLVVLLAFLSHYLLDFLPHIEYSNKKVKYIFLDFVSGLILIYIFSTNTPIIYICTFFDLIQDGFTLLDMLSNRKNFPIHDNFHRKKIHFLKNKKISVFWRLFFQISVTIFCLAVIYYS